jgi:putative colanic acid biosynthesis glycosyltransferase WcaI
MKRQGTGKTLLVFTQPFLPDPASVGQHMADAAIELARRGHRVVVITSDRGYDDPTKRYPRREIIGGVEVRRVPFTSFGKSRGYLRALGALVFMVRCLADGLFRHNLGGILFHTSPPFIGVVGAVIGRVRRCPIAYWTMDINPDQLIALGKISAHGPAAKLLGAASDFVLREATLIVALDRFMSERLNKRGNFSAKTVVIPPWPHEESLEPIPRAGNPFRARYGLQGKVVVMYSGNHSPSNPLTTLLDAALHFKDDPGLRFVFVGGGIGKKEVEDYVVGHTLPNVLSLPYQPLSELRFSLSAADVHVVSLGDGMAGIIHPCKIYGAMSVARPILYFGPPTSHVGDLLRTHDIGWQVSHGDVAGAIKVIQAIRTTSREILEEMGRTAQQVVRQSLDQTRLLKQFCGEIESRLLDANFGPDRERRGPLAGGAPSRLPG